MRKNVLHPYPAAVLETVRRRGLFAPSDRVLVALSGGADSTALLAALAALRDAGHLAAVVALHVDHGLRPDSAEDADCAASACERAGVPLDRARVKVARGNVQAAARRARYAALRSAALRAGATRIATGHTRSDQAETVLLRLLRGAGARGVAGIPPRRGALIRPLIDRSRAEGEAFLRDLDLGWREDPTNGTRRFLRNRLRLDVLPAIRAIAPAAERALARAADLAREDERALAGRARLLVPEGAAIALTAVAGEPLAVRRRIVRRLWRAASGSSTALEAHHVEAVLALTRRRCPGRVALPRGLEACCRYGTLELRTRARPAKARLAPMEIPAPGRYEVPALALALQVSAQRVDEVPWPLVLRTRRPGDRFAPDRGAGTKKLKAWLIDRKVPLEERDALLLLVAAGGRVLAIPELGAVADGLGPRGAGLEVALGRAR